jgi:hypothetical protein
MKRLCFFLCFLAFWQAQQVWAQQKYALVIGNSNYTALGKLKNPVNDAEDVAAALNDLGFNVDKVLDGDLDRMENAVLRLKIRLSVSKNAYGFLFYAGHGVQSNGVNYLIPVGANIPSEGSLRERSVSVQWMLGELNDAGNELNVVVLDACRDNPFIWGRSGSRGLTVIGNQPADSIVVYATSAGSVAQDGTGRNGLFTSHLLKNLKTPGLEIKEIFNRTGVDVIQASGRKQIPAVYVQFFGNAYFSKPVVAQVPITPPTVATPVPPPELPKAVIVPSSPLETPETLISSLNQNVETPELVIAPSKPFPVYTFTNVSDFKKWLSNQRMNTPAYPYNVKLNVKSLTGIKGVLRGASLKYVNLDLSGSKLGKIEYATFRGCTSLVCISIPSSVTSIGLSAFTRCSNLAEVIMENGIIIIGEYAFQKCTKLTKVIIPDSITSIRDNAFSGCTSLVNITIPNNVTIIEGYSFENCTSLTNISIPDSVTKIGGSAFSGCTNLTSVTFQGTIPFSGSSKLLDPFPGDLRSKFYATNKTNGTPGTYTRVSGGEIWTLQYSNNSVGMYHKKTLVCS